MLKKNTDLQKVYHRNHFNKALCSLIIKNEKVNLPNKSITFVFEDTDLLDYTKLLESVPHEFLCNTKKVYAIKLPEKGRNI